MNPSETIQTWLSHLHAQGKSEHTTAAYRRSLAHFARWHKNTYGDDFAPAAVIPRDVQDWKAHQQAVEKAKPATINQRLVALSRFFAWARKEGLIRADPTEAVKALRLTPRKPKAISKKTLRKLIKAAHERGSLRDVAIIEVLAGTGLRVSELLALDVGDVEIRPRSGSVTVRRGKRGSYREIPLTAPVRRALSAYLEEHPQARDPGAPLWLNQQGEALKRRSSVARVLNKYTLGARLEPIGPHALRHTFATRYLEAHPGDLRGLAALLGHADLSTVMVYTEPSQADLARRLEAMEQEHGA